MTLHHTFTDSPSDVSRKVEDDTIIFTVVHVGASAVYQCNVSNEHGYLLSNAFVNVLCKFITQDSFAFECFFFFFTNLWWVITWK